MSGHSLSFDDFHSLKLALEQALCPNEIGFTDDGYLTPCFTNTYLFTPLMIIITLWAISDCKGLGGAGEPSRSIGQHLNFALTVAYTVITFKLGGDVFNEISQLTTIFTHMVIFIIAFLQMKGVPMSGKPLEIYYFVAAAVSGYFVIQQIGLKDISSKTASATYVCLAASLAGSCRNIVSAFTGAKLEALKKA